MLAAASVILAGAAFIAGRAAPAIVPDPVQTHDGVPVGVDHSAAGAVAAADEYLASEQATVERAPGRFAVLVAEDYEPSLRASALAAADEDRLRDPGGMRLWPEGGQSFTLVGAHRLDWYRHDSAQVTAWAGQVFWGPGQSPCQVWSLGRIDLTWRGGRWQVTAMGTLPIAAPTPAALPQAAPSDDSGATFSSELSGFSPVSYGSPR